MVQNVKGVPKKDLAPPCTRREELDAYNSLPSELRKVIQESPISLSAISMLNSYIEYGNILALVQAARDTAWRVIYENPLSKNYPWVAKSFPHPDAKARRK